MDDNRFHNDNRDHEQEEVLLSFNSNPYAVQLNPKLCMAGDDEKYIDEDMDPEFSIDKNEIQVFGDEGEIAIVEKSGLPVDSAEESKEPDRKASLMTAEISATAGATSPVSEPDMKKGLQGMSDLKKHALGLFFIVCHCVTVVAAAQTAKATYSADFSAPFFLVYFRSCWRIVIFPVFMVLKYLLRLLRRKDKEPVSFMKTFTQCETVFGSNGLTAKTFVYPGGVLALLWITVQFTHVFAVKFLNNSIVQALFCSETAFCYLLSVLVLKIPIFVLKVLSVFVALGGVAFMAYSQVNDKDDLQWEGVAVCLIGAILGSIYMVAFKKLIGKSEDIGHSLLITSVMAVFITIVAWPVVLITQYTGIEYWNWETFPWLTVCISSTLTLVSISLFNLCLTLTSPFLMTLSKLLGIPANYMVDALFWNHRFDAYQIIGCIFIGIGFIMIALPEKWIACGRITKVLKLRRQRRSHNQKS